MWVFEMSGGVRRLNGRSQIADTWTAEARVVKLINKLNRSSVSLGTTRFVCRSNEGSAEGRRVVTHRIASHIIIQKELTWNKNQLQNKRNTIQRDWQPQRRHDHKYDVSIPPITKILNVIQNVENGVVWCS